jgi:lipopolysaccharide transport system permease protein
MKENATKVHTPGNSSAEMRTHFVIKPRPGWQLVDFRELIHYRDLFYFLVTREIRLRYKQTVLGGLWAIIQPLFLMLVFYLFFGRLAKLPSDNVPYMVFNYAAMVPWTYFSNSITISSNSLVQNTSLISKVYFPRIMIPTAPVFAFLLDFAIAFVLLLVMMAFYHIAPSPMVLLLPLLVVIMLLTAAGVGMFLSALSAKYRDITYTIAFLMQFWMFASPVVYPASILSPRNQLLYAINPMAGVIEGFRSTLLHTRAFPTEMVLISAAVSVLLFMGGALYFRRTERFFADVI